MPRRSQEHAVWRAARMISYIALLAIVAVGVWGSAPQALAAKGGGDVNIIRLGSLADVTPILKGPSFFLQGNGAPLPSAFDVHIDQVAAAPVDIVVLAASFATGGTSQSIECESLIAYSPTKINSCETITITKAAGANDTTATTDVNNAEIVYFAGGDQCNYVGWRGSSVYNAVKAVVARGGGVGGGSAGEAIQGEFIYDGCSGSVSSPEALANPYRNSISFSYDFFDWQNLGGVMTDSHFFERNRMGRTMAFVARQIQDGKASAVYGLGVDANTAVVIDKLGRGQVFGGVAYVVLGDHAPEVCAARQPLTFSNFKIWRLGDGATYNFANRPASGYYLRSVTNGTIEGDAYEP